MKYLYNGGPERVEINPADVLEVGVLWCYLMLVKFTSFIWKIKAKISIYV